LITCFSIDKKGFRMSKKKNIKLNKDETLESIEQELNNAIQFLETVNEKVLETLKTSQKEELETEKQNIENSNINKINPEINS